MAVAVDRGFMVRALELAARGEGRVSPNPLVGAVLVRDGRVVGEGWHRRFGGRHAEVEAMVRAGSHARGATLYVNLEPCNHHGKTPPCVDAIHAAGVARVVVAMRDPNPAVTGGGLEGLDRLGIEVAVGVEGEAARRLNESFLVHVLRRRPLVHWKCAQSLDGRIAAAGGESRWISAVPARARAQQLRFWSDAVLVGVGTVLADDPLLTVRGRRRKRVLRVILDRRLRTPPSSRLLAGGGGPVRIYAGAAAAAGRRRELERKGAEVRPVGRGADGRLDLRDVLADLAARGTGRLLVEGGGRVAASFVAAGLVDRVTLFVAPLLLGADGVPSVGAMGVERLAEARRLGRVEVTRLGRDLCIEAQLPSSLAGLGR
jgi:diaminohydroxyphosphoribosylaminopyrimidine deaminase/5-amino-6-(5-phosphoribosylamino)uracil reductase